MAVLVRRAADVRMYERDLSQVLISNSTAAAAMVAVSARGPSSKPIRYTNPNDFLRDFGNPNAKVSFDHYSALKFFEEGNNLWVIRAIGAGAKYAAAVVVVLANGDTSIRGIPGGLVDPENPNWNDLIGAGETPIFLVYAKSGQGSYGNNFSISIESSNLEQPQSLVGTSLPTDGSLQDGSYKYVVAALSKSGESLASSPSTVALAGGNGTAMVSLSWAPVIGAFGYAVYREVLVAGSPQYYLLAKVGAAAAEYQDRGYVTPDNSKVAVISCQLVRP